MPHLGDALLAFFSATQRFWIERRLAPLGIERPSISIEAAKTIASVRLGDGIARVRAGKRLPHKNTTAEGTEADSINLRWVEWPVGSLGGGLSQGTTRPSQTPTVCPSPQTHTDQEHGERERDCYYVGCDARQDENSKHFVENRRFKCSGGGKTLVAWEESVVVIREGLALPVRSLLELVNTVYAVLVVRGDSYFFLQNNFSLASEEEDSFLEWGMGRLVFANIYLAVGGLLLVAKAEKWWRPAVVGVLLVAAAAYRVQGTHTKLIRIRSVEWGQFKLVPGGLHGSERAVQLALLATLALADLLESRELLLFGLSATAFQVVVLEVLGQAATWGFCNYFVEVSKRILYWVWAMGVWWGISCAGYMVASFLTGMLVTGAVASVFGCVFPNSSISAKQLIAFIGFLSYNIFLSCSVWLEHGGVLHWSDFFRVDEFRVMAQPWEWPLLDQLDGLHSALRLPWLLVSAFCFYVLAGYVAIQSLLLRMGSDRTSEMVGRRGARGSGRERRGLFVHYADTSIPSRNVFHIE